MNTRRIIIPYDPALKQLARKLRNNSTLSEILLWKGLKNKQMKGYDFHRQKPLFRYVVDFFCNELLLAIEIDGASHENKSDEDQDRQMELEEFGITFLRFDDKYVRRDVNNTLLAIEMWIEEYERKNEEHTPGPSREGNKSISE
jgi:very-short-patch-repair endonuclease